MKRFTLVAVLLAALPALLRAADGGWTEDFEAAKTQAKKDGKDLLIDFTGSDWCVWCQRLHKEVFNEPAFKSGVEKNFILVELDYPRTKEQPANIKDRNTQLAKDFKIEGYPTVYLTDASGTPYAKTGYQAGGPEKYVQQLDGFRKRKDEIAAARKKAETASGAEKAKLLDSVLTNLEENGMNVDDQQDLVSQIKTLDADGKAGLKGKYEAAEKFKAILTAANGGDIDGAMTQVEAFIKTEGLSPVLKQQALSFKGALLHHKNDDKGAVEALKAAIAVDPNSDQAKRLEEVLTQLSKPK